MKDQELRQAGLKVTVPRLKILKILENAEPHHLSAENIYQQLREQGEEVGLATVYRVLTQFEASSLVKRHNFSSGQSIYELNQGEHHDHLVCENCSRVAEFVDEVIEQRQQTIAKQHGFKMTDHALTIFGLCQDCLNI